MNWYYDLGGQRHGPGAKAELDGGNPAVSSLVALGAGMGGMKH